MCFHERVCESFIFLEKDCATSNIVQFRHGVLWSCPTIQKSDTKCEGETRDGPLVARQFELVGGSFDVEPVAINALSVSLYFHVKSIPNATN